MKSSKQIVVQQPNNKKYLVEKTAKFEMRDQNDNQTKRSLKEEPFLVKRYEDDDETRRKIINCSDGILELDENGNPIEEVNRVKRSLKSSMIKHRNWNVFDSIDSPIIHHATNIGSTIGRKTLLTIDYVGNIFASIIGITGQKYENEIAQADFENKEKERRANVVRQAEAGWK